MTDSLERELVRQSGYGDQQAYTKLVRKYSNVIYSIVFSEVSDFYFAQDIAQECFVKAWFKLDQLQDENKFGAWIVSIAKNLCKDHVRKKRFFERPLGEAEGIAADDSLDEMVNRQFDRNKVWRAFEVLDEKYRTPTLMYYISGYKANEISDLLGIPLRTIETRIRRAKNLLKQELIDLAEQGASEIKLGEEFVGKVKARIKNALQVRLVKNLKASIQYYHKILGFTVDDWGHAEREGIGFLLLQAESPEQVRPNGIPAKSSYPQGWTGPPTSWDTYAYSDFNGVQSLYEEFTAKGATIAYPPQIEVMGDRKWKEFAVKDLDGYVIVFGGSN
ncbi:sigma-70 family RNA polymerase sigma factor [Paenibacillus nanensis]|uniref:Sigma-70 family RNA polymerase sigma factor n=1 Tax=Paenibacillus nanensis TaxID=393251 RepID=A0A3A1UTU2_9BACL|nr:sigma-70 family RNA polymerase sigma factor [Paenibacillus nanensis]RIX51674.1 sigma-70 family RNA polymerase sigma factor [Paenibacillus nanensis]